MERKDKSGTRSGKAKVASPASRPLSALHKDHGWTPEGLRAEIEAQGLDYDEEVAKQRRMVAEMATKHMASRKAIETPTKAQSAHDVSDLDNAPVKQ